MKKVLFVTTISNTINAFLIPHIELLVKKGHKVDIACNIVKEIDPKLIKLGCKIFNVEFQRMPLKKDNYTAYRKIQKIVVSEGYDLVHVHTPIASFLTRLACRNIANTKFIYTAHGFHFFKGAPLKNWLIYYNIEKWLGRFTDCIITINNEDYITAQKLLKINDVKYIPGVGIDLNKFKPQTPQKKKELRKPYGYNENDFILICIGELNHNKHQDLLINAVNVLKKKIPNVKLLLVGSGNLMEQYKNQVKKLNLERYIEFLGYRSDVPNLLSISDILVSASRREGLPVNVMEAMATGLPLVVTDCRGNRDLVRHGENGYVVGIDDVNKFAKSVEILHKSKELRGQFGQRSLEFIKDYSLENVSNQMKKIYSSYL
ncbi:glycosyltransferase family 4 protein [Garciella nitratireducens]|uniref:glycosyltransferase family 4 protein n=1 Tax=Garciella nitratireducens TaxID=218205 RepID=UPI001BD60D5C|nr:glycosyltransferase family 4 protein [Garciella nitratireducens]